MLFVLWFAPRLRLTPFALGLSPATPSVRLAWLWLLQVVSLTFVICKISSYIMRSTLTVSLPAKLRREMERAAASEHRNASEFVRDAIRTKLWQKSLDDSRDVLVPAARARGLYTDEDVFRAVS